MFFLFNLPILYVFMVDEMQNSIKDFKPIPLGIIAENICQLNLEILNKFEIDSSLRGRN